MLAFRKTFKDKNISSGKGSKRLENLKSITNRKISTTRRNTNKTYVHNLLMKKYILRNRSLAYKTFKLNLKKPETPVVKRTSTRKTGRNFRWNRLITKNLF